MSHRNLPQKSFNFSNSFFVAFVLFLEGGGREVECKIDDPLLESHPKL